MQGSPGQLLVSLVSSDTIDMAWNEAERLELIEFLEVFEFVLFGALGLLPAYSIFQGFSTQTSFNIIAILNA